MAECCVSVGGAEQVLRRSLLVVVSLGLTLAAARSAQQALNTTGYEALYGCTIAAEVMWIASIGAAIARLDRLSRAWTCFGVVCAVVTVLLSITELVIVPDPQPPVNVPGDGLVEEEGEGEDKVWVRIRLGAAYVAAGFLYLYYAYRHLRPSAGAAGPAAVGVQPPGQLPPGHLMEMTLGG